MNTLTPRDLEQHRAIAAVLNARRLFPGEIGQFLSDSIAEGRDYKLARTERWFRIVAEIEAMAG